MAAAKDIKVGHRYERLVVTGPFKRQPSGEAWFPVRCDCGTEFEATFRGFFVAKSCGCLQREGSWRFKHGDAIDGSTVRLYRIWVGMRTRCYSETHHSYPAYGGRGIEICASWRKSYPTFRAWALAHGYADDLSIDRINGNDHYRPGNCRWATPKRQVRNRHTNRLLTAFGETKCIADWTDDPRCVVEAKTLYSRVHSGWTDRDAITRAVQRNARWHN